MAGNLDLILAGIAGGGSGNALSAFAPTGTPMPAHADDALNVAFTDPGWISEDGLSNDLSVQSTDINGFGSSQPLRTLKTQQKSTFDLGFLESNTIALAIFHELPLDGLSPDSLGRFDLVVGPVRNQRYAGVFTVVDGTNTMVAACPNLQVTAKQSLKIANSAAIVYGVTLTAYPGSDGTAVHWMYKIPELAS